MNSYLNIEVLPDLEIGAQALLNNLFAKFHRNMSQTANGKIAVSFPSYKNSLGNILRLHADKEELSKFMQTAWLNGLRDYCRCSDIIDVPNKIKGYRCVYRYQPKSQRAKRQRAIKRGVLTEDQAWERYPETDQIDITLPFIQMKSLSSHNVMRLYIKMTEITDSPSSGNLSSYGLSRTTTIPWF